ncbi:MAG: two-component system phosphate regulon sensor histidine kinase PhoR [Alphaproteobacteria bacterium]|jgi:two-component system phosphate regulon sensor histidine kinase PhoR
MQSIISKIKNIFLKKPQNKDVADILLTAFIHDKDALILVDIDSQVIDLNLESQKIFPHLSKKTSIKSALRAPIIHEAFDELKETDKSRIIVDFSLKIPNEQNFHAVIIKTKTGFFIRLQDITEQKRALKMHTDFVANVSHEMRTPLASICGFIETLQGPAKGDADATEQFLAIMDAQSKRMKALVDGLLSLSRIELNRHITPTDRIELSGVMADVAASTEPLARHKNMTITYAGDDTPRYTLGNRDEVFQVIQNLVENAIKYSDKDTAITLKIEDKNQGWGLSVHDQGRGIDAAHIARLTERFYRVDDARNRKEGGAGLGLSIVSSILARHKSHLNIQSEPNKGSIFTAIMPKYNQA